MNIRRGDIYYADLSPVVGSEQGGLRPVLIIQNDVGNRYSPTVIAAAITSRMGKTRLPTHIDIYAERAGLAKDSVILLEQIRTLDKRRLKERMGHLDDHIMNEVNNAIAVSFGLGGILTPPESSGSEPLHETAEPVPAYAAMDDHAPAVAVSGTHGGTIAPSGIPTASLTAEQNTSANGVGHFPDTSGTTTPGST